MSEKKAGYALLFSGVFILIFSTISIVLVFAGYAAPIKLVDIPTLTVNTPGIIPSVLGGKGQNPLELLPMETLNDILNKTGHFFLMTFILNLGFKLASLGVQLLRPIVVKEK